MLDCKISVRTCCYSSSSFVLLHSAKALLYFNSSGVQVEIFQIGAFLGRLINAPPRNSLVDNDQRPMTSRAEQSNLFCLERVAITNRRLGGPTQLDVVVVVVVTSIARTNLPSLNNNIRDLHPLRANHRPLSRTFCQLVCSRMRLTNEYKLPKINTLCECFKSRLSYTYITLNNIVHFSTKIILLIIRPLLTTLN